ncbi:MAG TPA: hypothetical protein VE338_14345 [Ktedonobacterales bacterium]|jgi:MFS family permease|nr:hypothetical protein [Ktedonobacterales bacterium]
MLLLALFWMGLGVCVGAMAVAARLTPPRWEGRRWLATPALGAGAALLGGWLGAMLLDHIFASFTALCVSVAAVGAAGMAGRTRRASATKE